MKPRATIDASKFRNQLRAYVKFTRAGWGEGIRKQARLLAKDLIKATPPFAGRRGGKGTFRQSWKVQKDTGTRAVARDVTRVFSPALPASVLNRLPDREKTRAKRYLRQGKHEELATMLYRLSGGHGNAPSRNIVRQASRALHQQRRDSNGRVTKGATVYVQRPASIRRLIRSRQKDVGKWKAGWMPAARALRVKGIPKWISGKAGAGYYRDKTNALNPYFLLANTLRGESGRNLRIAKAALQNRERSMRTEIERRMNHAKKRAKL